MRTPAARRFRLVLLFGLGGVSAFLAGIARGAPLGSPARDAAAPDASLDPDGGAASPVSPDAGGGLSAPDRAPAAGSADGGGLSADGPAPPIPEGPAGPAVKAPIPLVPVTPTYPPQAMKDNVEGDVALILGIDHAGLVTEVEVEAGLPGGLTEAAVTAARVARFRPALDAEGRATPVRLRWLVHFTLPERRSPAPRSAPAPAASASPTRAPAAAPPAPTPALEAPPPPGVTRFPREADTLFTVHVRERGTGKDLPTATVFLLDVGELLQVDARARAERRLAPGAYVVVVRAPGHVQEERIERLYAGQRLDRTYFIQRERLNEYETIVRARPPRPETGVVTLQAEEIHNIPGTFGDPFRTAMLLPGVGSIVSGLGYPVIRGESPGQTGTFIDDIRVPLLYHLGFGPAVVHPLYLASLDFHPGNFPAEFGRFTGALIRAHTTEPAPEAQTMLSMDLFKLSAFHTRPTSIAGREASVSAAARYGTFAFLARAIDPRAVLTYWDYQLRADMKLEHGDVRLLVFGAQDTTGTSAGMDRNGNLVQENLLRLGFHRLSLTYRGRWGRAQVDGGVEVGPDYTRSTGDPDQGNVNALTLRETVLRPRVAVTIPVGKLLKVRLGADLLTQWWDASVGSTDVGPLDQLLFPRYGLTPGAFIQADWQPTPRWLIRPGVRIDHYAYVMQTETYKQTGIDPRISARFQVRPGLFVKGGVGIYRSPPRFLLPWPGLTGFGLNQGLNQSNQLSFGAEAILPWDSTLDGQVYFNWLPRVSEFAFGQSDNSDDGLGNNSNGQSTYRGRSYGLELIARRRLGHRLFGWITYTLARSERDFPAAGWRVADFDQTQIVNTVVSYALGRSWTVSTVFHYNSGRPFTPPTATMGGGSRLLAEDRNLRRLPDFWRVDLRIEKREAFDTWYLDFYVDWLNISLQNEAVSWDESRNQAQTTLITIPTIGLQAVF